jgi:acetyl-CoA C-acetyltransferase
VSALDPRTPVLVGVGQVVQREGDAPEPVDLMVDAARRAADDAGGDRLLGAVESVRIVNVLSRRYPDPGALVAERLELGVRETVYGTLGGHTPQALITQTAMEIRSGAVDVVLIAGGESWRTRNRLRARGERSPWSTQPDDVRPTRTFGTDLDMASIDEDRVGLGDPVQVYPMFEQALRGKHGRTLAEQVQVAAELWSRFSAVAAANPYAAIRREYRADEIATPGPDNRMIGFPYPKLMNSNSSVDQASALLMCSAEHAAALGVPRDRWVFLHGAAAGNDTQYLSNRDDLAASPAVRLAGRAALAGAGIGVDDLAHVDLYACFPSSVQVGAAELGLGLDRELTVTGGNTFGGGPWSNHVGHAVATMVGRLRDQPEAYGLCWGNGGFLTKHAIGVYSCREPERPLDAVSVQAAVDALPSRRAEPHFEGDATVEAYTVMYDRAGEPVRAFAFARLDDAGRTLAASDDESVVAACLDEDPLGRRARVADGVLVGVA